MFEDLQYVQSLEKEMSMLDFDNYCDMACKYLDRIKEREHLEFELSKQNEFLKYKPTKLSKQNEFLKYKIATQFQKDFSKIEAHCVALELKYQNQALKSGQHGRVLKDIDAIETINIELEHNVAKLFQENENLHKQNEHLKQTYKDFFDSIKLTRENRLRFQILSNDNFFRNHGLLPRLMRKRLIKTVTPTILPQREAEIQAVKNSNAIKPGMYRIDTKSIQTRTPQLPQTFRNSNHRVSTSTKVTHIISVSRPQLRSTKMQEKVVSNNSQVTFKKTESRTSNAKVVCVTCVKCVFNSNHDACVFNYINDVNARTKKPKPISTRKPTKNVNQSVAIPHKKTIASKTTIQKSSSYFRMLYEKTSKAWTWWIEKQCPSGYIWKPKVKNDNALASDILPLDVKSRFTTNSEPFNKMGSNLTNSPSSSKCFADRTNHPIHRRLWMQKAHDEKSQVVVVYYVKGLNHNLFSVGQFYDANLEVVLRKSTCFVRDIQGNDLLMGTRGSDLYTIALQESSSPTSICFMAKASPIQAWLRHCRLSHLNFDTINLISKNVIMNGLPKLKYVKDQLYSSCKMGKAKLSNFKTKTVPGLKGRLHLLHIDLCGPMRVESINGKKYILVIVDDYSRYTWTHFLRSKDKTPEVLIDFLKMIQRGLQTQVINVRTDRGTKMAQLKDETVLWLRLLEQCFRLLNVYSSFGLKQSQPDGENLDKMKEKGDLCIFVGYATKLKEYRVYNKRTRLIIKSIHINFDEIKEMALEHNSLCLAPQRQMASDYDNSGLVPQLQKTFVHNSTELRNQDHNNEHLSSKLVPNDGPTTDKTDTSLQELELLFSPMYEEYLNEGNKSVSKSFALFDNPQQQDTQPMNVQPISEPIIPPTDVNVEEINTD
ncbi:retrovirus-related pol polyprotein from transposon TNT 1-94 [Tanacetum coccineum]